MTGRIGAISLFFWVSFFCLSEMKGQSMASALKLIDVPKYQEEIYLDYQADSVRNATILDNMNFLESGMPIDSVLPKLGLPDESSPVFVQGPRGENIEWVVHTYLISRAAVNEWGKTYNDQSITIKYNLSGQLVSATSVGISNFDEIVREQGLGFKFEIGLHEHVKIENLLLQLDFVLETGNATEAGNAQDETADESKVLLTITLLDRKGGIELMEIPEKRAVLFRDYKISLIGINSKESATLLIE